MLKASTKDVLILCFVILMVLFAAWFIGIRKAHAGEMYDATTDPELKQEKGRIIIGEESTTTTIPEEDELTPEQKQFKEDREKYPDATCFETNPDTGRSLPCERRPMQMPKVVPHKPDRDKIFVQYYAAATEANKNELHVEYKLKKQTRMNLIPYSEYLIITDGTDPETLINLIKNNPKFTETVRYSETVGGEDAKLQGMSIPLDTYWRQEWYLKRINMPRAWDYFQFTPGTNWRNLKGWVRPTIAIIDSGDRLCPGNRDFNCNNLVRGCDWYSSITTCKPAIDLAQAGSHGTAVASIIGALRSNGLGITGMDSNMTIIMIRACNYDICNVDAIVQAIYQAVAMKARIINMSFTVYGQYQKLQEAIEYAASQNILLVVAAGNGGLNLAYQPVYPAVYEQVMTVAGTDRNNALVRMGDYNGTRWGSNCCFNISVSAPSVAILAYGSSDAYYVYQWDGTSFGTALVTAAAAMLLDKYPKATASWIRHTIEKTATPIRGCPVWQCGYGVMDVYKALQQTYM